jgi:hypothetical protein
MPLIRRSGITLTLENMTQMATTIRAYDLRPLHTEVAIGMSFYGAWNAVKVGRPSTARLELLGGFVERGVAGSASVDTGLGHMLIISASEGGFGALLTEDTELFCSGL